MTTGLVNKPDVGMIHGQAMVDSSLVKTCFVGLGCALEFTKSHTHLFVTASTDAAGD